MKIECFFSCHNFKLIAAETVVVIDVLRATSTIATALANGAKEIIPVREIEQALKIRESLPEAILAGERNGEILESFDFGNSPAEYTRPAVENKTVIICTTNGTAAIEAAKEAPSLLCGALINAQAVSEAIGGNSLALLCSGTAGEPSYDDIIGAGAIIYNLYLKNRQLDLTDTAKIAYQSYMINRERLLRGLQASKHGNKLCQVGCGQDVVYCARENIIKAVPVYRDGRIVKL